MTKILIVDDDKDIAELISLILKKENIDADIITDSLTALAVLQSPKNQYDLILLDIMMPELSGTELCSKIRSKVEVPIIFLSAKKESIDKMLGYEIGGDDYITKPFDNAELVLKIKSHLKMSKRALKELDYVHFLNSLKLKYGRTTLTTTACIYIASVATTFLEILRFILIFGKNDDF